MKGDNMKYPFYKCTKCGTEIAEMSFPIHPAQQYPHCPKCHSNKNVDIVLGNEDTKMDENTVIYSDNRKEVV